MKRLIKKSKLQIGEPIHDSLKYRKSKLSDEEFDLELFQEARDVYLSQDSLRKTRLRNIRYVYGDQWGDYVKDEHGNPVKERDRIAKRTGGVALQNNHLFKVVNTMAGIYVKSSGKPVVYARQANADKKASVMTNALQCNYDNNSMEEVMMSEFIEMLCGGVPVLSEEWATHEREEDAYSFPIDLGYFAFRSKGGDPRVMWDVDFIVEIRDYTLGGIKTEFGKKKGDIERLDAIYAPYLNIVTPGLTDPSDHETNDWDYPPGRNLCRTWRVWTQEYKPRYRCVDYADFDQPVYRIDKDDLDYVRQENNARRQAYKKLGVTDEEEMVLIQLQKGTDERNMPILTTDIDEAVAISEERWHCTVFGPGGIIIEEFDSPYDHGQHPYVFTAHQLVNGRVYPFINVVIDQQRYVNRLITLQDLYINSSIKGLKMVPRTMLGGLSPREFARRAVEMGGWIFYEPDERFPNLAPQIIQQNSHDIGVSDLLQIQLNSIDEITTVSAAVRGAAPQSGTPASRYALETENAITSLAALYKKFNVFENDCAKKKLQVIQQYYQEPRNVSIWHTNGLTEEAIYDPKEVQDMKFSVVVRQAPDTPVSRMTNNDLFKEMWLRGVLNTKQLLQYSDLPGTEQLRQDLEAMEEQAQQQGQGQVAAQGAPQMLSNSQEAAAATQDANQSTVGAIQKALRSDLGSLTMTGV